MVKAINYYQHEKELGKRYRESQENITFHEWKKQNGIHAGRPIKPKRIKKSEVW